MRVIGLYGKTPSQLKLTTHLPGQGVETFTPQAEEETVVDEEKVDKKLLGRSEYRPIPLPPAEPRYQKLLGTREDLDDSLAVVDEVPRVSDLLHPNVIERIETITERKFRLLPRFKYYWRRKDGRDQLVVLLGEGHIKSNALSQSERAVVNSFFLRGVEGAGFTSTLQEQVMLQALRPAFFFKDLIISRLPFVAGSSIDTAKYSSMPAGDIIKAMDERSRKQIKDIVLKLLSDHDVDPDDEKTIMKATMTFNYPTNKGLIKFKFEGQEILDVINDKLDNLKGRNVTAETFSLEDGIVHTWRSSVVAGYLVYLNLVLFGGLALDFVDNYVIDTSTNLLLLAADELVGPMTICHIFIGGLLSLLLPRESPVRLLAFPLNGLTADRDIAMAKNIDGAFETHEDEDNQIDIMGLAHLPGVSYYLENSYGFTEISM